MRDGSLALLLTFYQARGIFMRMKSFATVRECTRLRAGMRIRMSGDEQIYHVVMVNDCRALCEPETKTREVKIPQRFGEEGEVKTFMARAGSISISPNSDVKVLCRKKSSEG